MVSEITLSQLLGIAGPPPLDSSALIESFADLGHNRYTDGWGFSGFSAGRAVYFDRQAADIQSMRNRLPAISPKVQSVQSPVVIGHLRKKTVGDMTIGNTHPFHHRDWILAHDGSVFNPEKLDINGYTTQGDTDSERLCVWLIDRLSVSPDPQAELVELLAELRDRLEFDSLNFLLSDGITLWGYRETRPTKRPSETPHALHWAPWKEGLILCSVPLEVEALKWKELPERTLITYLEENRQPIFIQT